MAADNYDDIIDLPHHVSERYPRMSMRNRAAQFSPFAALTGFGSAVEETARLTETKTELSEDEAADMDAKLRILSDNADKSPAISVRYFRPDSRKDGGAYLTVCGNFRKVDVYGRRLVFTDGTSVNIDGIISIEGEIFDTAGYGI